MGSGLLKLSAARTYRLQLSAARIGVDAAFAEPVPPQG
jgi:hypothetical protein